MYKCTFNIDLKVLAARKIGSIDEADTLNPMITKRSSLMTSDSTSSELPKSSLPVRRLSHLTANTSTSSNPNSDVVKVNVTTTTKTKTKTAQGREVRVESFHEL